MRSLKSESLWLGLINGCLIQATEQDLPSKSVRKQQKSSTCSSAAPSSSRRSTLLRTTTIGGVLAGGGGGWSMPSTSSCLSCTLGTHMFTLKHLGGASSQPLRLSIAAKIYIQPSWDQTIPQRALAPAPQGRTTYCNLTPTKKNRASLPHWWMEPATSCIIVSQRRKPGTHSLGYLYVHFRVWEYGYCW
jgi:hypothetical protein